MSGGSELVALTGAAVQPLLLASSVGGGGSFDDTACSSLPTYTIFSPLAGACTSSLAATPSPRASSPQSLSAGVTPSPLTISARDMEPGSMTGNRLDSLAASVAGRGGGGLFTPAHTPRPGYVTPIPGAGVKIRISAKKVREVASPRVSPGVDQPQRNLAASLSFESCSSDGETPRALSPMQPYDPAVEESSQPMTNGRPQGKSLAQGILRSTDESPSLESLLESSVIIRQTEATVPAHEIKERLLQQQAVEKQQRFKMVQPQLVTRPLATLGEGGEESIATKFSQPQMVNGGGVRSHTYHSRVAPKSKEQQRSGTCVRRLPASSFPPTLRLQSTDSPTTGTTALVSRGNPHTVSKADSTAAGNAVFPASTSTSRLQFDQFPRVSSTRDHADTSRSTVTTAAAAPASSSSSVAFRSSIPATSPASFPPPHLGFAETVRLVASCTAAATAAALASQRGPSQEAKVGKSITHSEPLVRGTSKEPALNFPSSSIRPTTAGAPPHMFSAWNSRGGMSTNTDGLHTTSHANRLTNEKAELERWNDFSTEHSHASTTAPPGFKGPLAERKTRDYAQLSHVPPAHQSPSRKGKQKTSQNNLTPHSNTHSQQTRGRKTADDLKTSRGSPPSTGPGRADSSVPLSEMQDDFADPNVNFRPTPSEFTATEHSMYYPGAPTFEPVGVGFGTARQQALFEVEKVLMEVQQARRDLDTHSALAEARERWENTVPSVPTDDLSNLGCPEHRVAEFLNQLCENLPAKESSPEKEQQKDGKETKPSRKDNSEVSSSGLGGRRMHWVREKEANSRNFPTKRDNSQRRGKRGRLYKGKNTPVSKPLKTYRPVAEKLDSKGEYPDVHQKDVKSVKTSGADVEKSKDTVFPASSSNAAAEPRWMAPPPLLPMLHSRVLAPGNALPGIPVGVYTLPSGMVACDPSTGMPLQSVPSSALGPMVPSIPPPPLPPCIHMPTAIPLGPPCTMPSQAIPLLVGSAVPSAEQFVHSHNSTAATSPHGTPTKPSVTDVCLQTSFSEHGESPIRDLVQEVLPATNISTDLESLNESSDLNSTTNTPGISLTGKHAPYGQTSDPPCFPVTTALHGENEHGDGGEVSAQEMDRRTKEHLEAKALEWVTQELLTRVMAANQSRDRSRASPDQLLDDSINSCSTCTPPHSPHPPLTSALPHSDIATANLDKADDRWFGGTATATATSGEGEGVRSVELVEGMVRDVVREKVVEAVREAQARRREEEEERMKERNKLHAAEDGGSSYMESGSGYSSDWTHTNPLIPTPSPSPPPPRSPSPSSPSHSSQDDSAQESHPLLWTPNATPPSSRRSESTTESPTQALSTPQVTEDEVSAIAPELMPGAGEGGESPTSVHLPCPITTPPPSPPDQIPPTPTPPSLTKEEYTPHSLAPSLPLPSPPRPNQFSLSESSSSSPSTTSTEAHRHPHSLTTVTNLTTDQEISMGECMLTRPPLPGAASSLSEGEVALSPGDARWYATYAAKMDKWGPQSHSIKPGKPKLTPVVAAFLELKNSPNSSSDTSEYSSSFQTESKTVSEGEATKHKPRHANNPFDRFLAKLQSSSPESSSTPTPPTTEDNTLSDMPSIADNDSLSRGEVRDDKESTPIRPLKAQPARKKHSLGSVGASTPYHRQFPLQAGQSASPGEVRSNPPSEFRREVSKRRDKSDLFVSFARSEGEVHSAVQQSKKRPTEKAQRPLPELNLAASPGELRIKQGASNKTRDGIDVINIASFSPNSVSSISRKKERSSCSTASLPSQKTPHTLSSHSTLSSSSAQPVSSSRRLRVSELEPARLIQVASSPAVLDDEDSVITLGSRPGPNPAVRQGEIFEASRAGGGLKKTQQPTLSPASSHVAPDTARPGFDSLLQTSSSSDLSPRSPSHLSAARPKDIEPLTKQKSLKDTPSPPAPQLHSFWDTSPRRSPYLPASRVVQQPSSAPRSVGSESKQSVKHTHMATSPLGGQGTQAAVSSPTHQPSFDSAKPVVPLADRDRNQIVETDVSHDLLPIGTRMKVSVPTATVEEEGEESLLSSPAPSPAYSSDFEFSSISQPTFD